MAAASSQSDFPNPWPDLLPQEDLRGRIINERYQVTDLLGMGGGAVVFKARHVLMDKVVALKAMRRAHVEHVALVQRFLNEARAVGRLRHEHIIDVTDVGRTQDGVVYFVMEFLDGEDLSTLVDREGKSGLPWARVKPIALQICRALHAAHKTGIVHRDLKLENIFRVKRSGNADFVKILDFGIAKEVNDEAARHLTRTGMIIGTPSYMSPEQARGQGVDARTDIYAMGVVLYVMLTGKFPFDADTAIDILAQHITQEPRSLRTVAPQANLSREVDDLVLQCLQKRPEDRVTGMHALAEAILRVPDKTVPAVTIDDALRIRDATADTILYREADLSSPDAPDEPDLPRVEPTPEVSCETKAAWPRWGWGAGGIGVAAILGFAFAFANEPDEPPAVATVAEPEVPRPGQDELLPPPRAQPVAPLAKSNGAERGVRTQPRVQPAPTEPKQAETQATKQKTQPESAVTGVPVDEKPHRARKRTQRPPTFSLRDREAWAREVSQAIDCLDIARDDRFRVRVDQGKVTNIQRIGATGTPAQTSCVRRAVGETKIPPRASNETFTVEVSPP